MAKKAPDKVISLYNGEVAVEYFDRYHQYFVNGEKQIGVTTVTGLIDKSRVLIYWAVNLAKKHLKGVLEINGSITEVDIEDACRAHATYLKDASSLGTQVHEWAESYINAKLKERKDIPLPEDERVMNGVLAFLQMGRRAQGGVCGKRADCLLDAIRLYRNTGLYLYHER